MHYNLFVECTSWITLDVGAAMFGMLFIIWNTLWDEYKHGRTDL